jgi:hypothetical protein
MSSSVTVFFLCLPISLIAQVNLQSPRNYYTSSGERVGDYIHRTYTDPGRLMWLFVDSATATWSRDPHEWDRSAQSYSYRVASGLGRRVVRNTTELGFEALLSEDSRYHRSNENGILRRVFFALSHSVLAYKPDGSVEPAYGRIAAGVIGAAVSSTWHPQSVSPTALAAGVGQCTLDRAADNLLTEFQPDLLAFGKKAWNRVSRK